MSLYNALSLASFNLELLAPECRWGHGFPWGGSLRVCFLLEGGGGPRSVNPEDSSSAQGLRSQGGLRKIHGVASAPCTVHSFISAHYHRLTVFFPDPPPTHSPRTHSSHPPLTLSSFSVTFESKWIVTQMLPLILVGAVGIVLLLTRLLQLVQRRVFKVLPFGSTGDINLVDVCIGVLITGSYYLYFRTCPE